jgi:hypothetical protein
VKRIAAKHHLLRPTGIRAQAWSAAAQNRHINFAARLQGVLGDERLRRASMAASPAAPTRATRDHDQERRVSVTKSTETKAAFKTTELMAYIAAVVAVLIAGAVIDESNAGGLGAKQVWLYVTILTVGYMISRGLAKSGSRDPYRDER